MAGTVTKTVVMLELVGHGFLALLQNDVEKLVQETQRFIEAGLRSVGAKKAETPMQTTGDRFILVFDDAMQAYDFGLAIHRATTLYNADKTDPLTRLSFRIGVATGAVTMRAGPADRYEVAGVTVASAGRLGATSKAGELCIDTITFDSFPPDVQALFPPCEVGLGKRDERFHFHRLGVNKDNSILDHDEFIYDHDMNTLFSALDRLSERDRTLLDMIYYNKLSYDDVSKELNLRPAAVRIQFWRARAKLRELVAKTSEHVYSKRARDQPFLESLRLPPSESAPPSPSESPPGNERSDHFDALSATVPEGVKEQAVKLARSHYDYRVQYASQLEPIVNARIRHAIDSGTSYEYKKELIKSLNEELRLGGLAIRCEVADQTGNVSIYPGIFVIGTARHGGGRFRVEYQDAGGKTTVGLPDESASVKLMAHLIITTLDERNQKQGRSPSD